CRLPHCFSPLPYTTLFRSGAYKFKPGTKPQLRFDVLAAVEKNLPGFPIVLHGSSSVPQNFVDEINKYGGNMPGAIGVPEDQLRRSEEHTSELQSRFELVCR